MIQLSDLARRLGARAEDVCRRYLSNGRRQGRYWIVGDVANNKGGSLYVRLNGFDTGRGAAGKWTDAATGQHGDLIDLIRLNLGHTFLADTLREARDFLSLLPQPPPLPPYRHRDNIQAARRLFQLSRPLHGTLAETYLRARGITARLPSPPLRFHPACFYRRGDDGPLERWPALIAAITDLQGRLTGVQRTYLSRTGTHKAPIPEPRRTLGLHLGFGVRFGHPTCVLAAGEGLETMLALRSLLPGLPMVAALSANHLAALILPPGLQRLYLAADNDRAGLHAAARLSMRARDAGITPFLLLPPAKDWNEALTQLPPSLIRAALATQLAVEDAGMMVPG